MMKEVAQRFAESLIRDGEIDPRGKTDKEIHREISQFLSTHKLEFLAAIDYTGDILKQARNFARSKQYLFSCIFYAMWFEHWLNRVIAMQAKRKKLTQEEILQIIRETQFRAKTTWLLRILNLKPINNSHLKRMQAIVDVRNSFVHYKWKHMDIDDESFAKEGEQARKLLEEAEKTISYLQRLEVIPKLVDN